MAGKMQMVLAPEMAMIPRKKNPKNRKTNGGGSLLTYVDTPAARQVHVKSRAPVIRTNSNCTIIDGHEQIATVSGSVSFTTTKFQVNPGLAFYTWLSSRATGWEKYRFRSFEIMYVPAEANTTTPGSVYLVADYDPTDAPPQTLQALSTYETQQNGRVYNAMTLKLSTKRMFDGVQTKYIREGPVASDLSLYDAASFTFATISCANTTPIGQLWVRYVVELISPQTESSVPASPSFAFMAKPELTDQAIPPNADTPVTFVNQIVNGAGVLTSGSDFVLPKANWFISGVLNVNQPQSEAVTFRILPVVDGAPLDAFETFIQPTSGTTYQSWGLPLPFNAYVSSNGKTRFRIDVRTTDIINPENYPIISASGTTLAFRVV